MDTIRETPPSPLRLERIKQGIKLWRMSNLLGVSQSLYSYYELGRRRIPADKKRSIGKALGITDLKKLDELMPDNG